MKHLQREWQKNTPHNLLLAGVLRRAEEASGSSRKSEARSARYHQEVDGYLDGLSPAQNTINRNCWTDFWSAKVDSGVNFVLRPASSPAFPARAPCGFPLLPAQLFDHIRFWAVHGRGQNSRVGSGHLTRPDPTREMKIC